MEDFWREARTLGAECAARFQLNLRGGAWQAGQLLSAGAGVSLDFKDHRSYMPGDDPRHINWQAYARTGHATMKVFHQETAPLLDLYLDRSPSMFYPEKKARRTLELLAFSWENARRTGGGARLFLRDGREWVLERSGEPAPGSWDFPEPGVAREGLFAGMVRAARRPGSVRIWISDFLEPGFEESLWSALGPGPVLFLVPFASEERAPAWQGWVELIDCETGRWKVRQADPGLHQRYRAHYERHFEMLREASLRKRYGWLRIPVETPLTTALAESARTLEIFETPR